MDPAAPRTPLSLHDPVSSPFADTRFAKRVNPWFPFAQSNRDQPEWMTRRPWRHRRRCHSNTQTSDGYVERFRSEHARWIALAALGRSLPHAQRERNRSGPTRDISVYRQHDAGRVGDGCPLDCHTDADALRELRSDSPGTDQQSGGRHGRSIDGTGAYVEGWREVHQAPWCACAIA